MDGWVTKGTRVRACWFEANNQPHSLAGNFLKIGATERVVVGTVRHVWGDHPTAPTKVTLAIEPDDGSGTVCSKCNKPHVEVDAKHVVAILV